MLPLPLVALIAALVLPGPIPAVTAAPLKPALVPESVVHPRDEKNKPYWKLLWDEARAAVRQQDYEKALQKYQFLLQQKKEINEARWEYVTILLHVGKRKQGMDQLELLIEAEPQEPRYLVRLADVLRTSGGTERAVELYQRALGVEPERREAVAGLAHALLDLNRKKEALPLFETLHGWRKKDVDTRRQLAQLYYEAGLFQKAAPHFRALSDAGKLDGAALVMAAENMDRWGRENLAVGYWRQVLDRDPQNATARKRLTQFYRNEGMVQEAVATLQALLDKDPKNPEVLNQLGRIYLDTGEFARGLETMERYLSLRPDDRKALHLMVDVTLRLASESMAKGDLDVSRDYLGRLTEADHRSPEFLLGRAALYEKMHRPALAILDYEAVIGQSPGRDRLRMRLVRLAGLTGDYARIRKYFGSLSTKRTAEEQARASLVYAAALGRCSMLEEAREVYAGLLSDASGSLEIRVQAMLGQAAIFKKRGRRYETEQTLRQILELSSGRREALVGLYTLALETGALGKAEYWLDRLERETAGGEDAMADKAWPAYRKLLRVRLLARLDEGQEARELGARLLAGLDGVRSAPCLEQRDGWLDDLLGGRHFCLDGARLALELSRAYLTAGEVGAAEELLLGLNTYEVSHELEMLVLLQKVHLAEGRLEKRFAAYSRTLEVASRDLGSMVFLAGLYREAGLYNEMQQVAAELGELWPVSLSGSFFMAEALARNNDLAGADAAYSAILQLYPNNIMALEQRAQQLFRQGRYDESLALCETVLLQPGLADDPGLLLLQARGLWAMGRWAEALKVYDACLTPAVDEQFASLLAREQLHVSPRKAPRAWWNYLTFTKGKQVRPLEEALRVPRRQDMVELGRLATPLYARYRWQADIALERRARLAVSRREYLSAARQYEELVQVKPEDASLLFDLAGIYSKLGQLGDEAATYETLAEMRPDYPGLAEAAARNRLKRMPRIYGGYRLENNEGWNGYIDINTQTQVAGVSLSPKVQHEIDLSAARLRYQSSDDGVSLWARRVLVDYRVDFFGRFSFNLGGGGEKMEEGREVNYGLGHCRLSGKLGDRLSGYLAGERQRVADTLASIQRGIMRQIYSGGLRLDMLPRAGMGLDYTYQDYSDDNATQGYDLWFSYVLLNDPYLLQLRYVYDFRDTLRGENPGPPLADGFGASDHPYWVPLSYWKNTLGLYFKHSLSGDTFGRGAPQYYTVEYQFGYDSKGNALQKVRGCYFMEWSPHFLTELSGGVVSSEVMRSKDLFFSIAYRW